MNSFRVYTTDDTSADVINIPTEANTDIWGLIRNTSEGSVGILFDNNDQLTQPEAYIRYVDSMDVVHTEKLLTSADIPSASGVVSFNGMTGIVVVKGSDLIVSTTDTRTIAQAITDAATTDYAIKNCIAYVENTVIATQNIPVGSYVIWQNNDYISNQAISIGDTLSNTNLDALNTGGICNTIKTSITSMSNQIQTIETNINKLRLFTGMTGSGGGSLDIPVGTTSMFVAFIMYRDPNNSLQYNGMGIIRILAGNAYFNAGKINAEGITNVAVSDGTLTISMQGYCNIAVMAMN